MLTTLKYDLARRSPLTWRQCATTFLLLPCLGFGKTPEALAENLLRKHYSDNIQIENISIALLASEQEALRAATHQTYARDTLRVLFAVRQHRTLGFAVVDEVQGKDQPITYCIILNEELALQEVKITAYREPYGGEVQNESWLEQFSGKKPGDELRPGKEIKNITGATISSRAVTLGVKKILALLRIVQPRLQPSARSTSRLRPYGSVDPTGVIDR